MPSPQGSAKEADRQERRFLIAAGTARYPHLPDDDQLPSVDDDLHHIVELFTRKLGYQRVLPELGNSPKCDTLRRSLSKWLRHADRRASDVIVFYYSGHGGVESGFHYLLTSDSEGIDSEGIDFAGTALSTENLARMLHGTPIQQLLVLLDTCYSGQGAVDFFRFAGEVVRSIGRGEELPSGIYAMAAARPKDEAQQGAFAQAFVHAVENPTGPYAGNRQPYLLFDPLVGSINEEFKNRHLGQRARLHSGPVGSVPRILPNPHYALVSRKKCTNPCSCETIVCTIPVASAAWCDRQA